MHESRLVFTILDMIGFQSGLGFSAHPGNARH